MRARIIRLGTSWAIQVPEAMLEKVGLEGEVDLRVEGESLVIRRVSTPRAGWADAFRAMAERGDDAVLDPDLSPSTWDESEWEY